jgi:hypothetical protein
MSDEEIRSYEFGDKRMVSGSLEWVFDVRVSIEGWSECEGFH